MRVHPDNVCTFSRVLPLVGCSLRNSPTGIYLSALISIKACNGLLHTSPLYFWHKMLSIALYWLHHPAICIPMYVVIPKVSVNLLFWCPVISHLFCMYNVINWLHDIQDFLSFIPYGTWLLKNLLILWRWPHSDSFNFFQPPHSLPPISPAYPLLWHHPDAPPHVWIPRLSERLALASWWLLWYFSWVHSLVWLKSYFCLIQCGQAITACSDFLWLCHSIHRGWRWAALLCISQPPRARTSITMWWRQSFPSSITTTVEEVPTKDQSLNAIAAPSLRASATVSHPCPSGHPDGNKKSREALHGFKSIPSRSIIIELSDSLHCPKHIVTPKL